jgi:hypothetical protein
MHRSVWLTLFLIPLLHGCGNGDDPTFGVTPVPVGIRSAVRSVDALNISVSVPKNNYAQGESIPIRLIVANNGLRDVTLRLSSSSRAAYVIKQGNTEITRGSIGGAGVITFVPLAKGDGYSFELPWAQQVDFEQFVPPGVYSIQAYVPGYIDEGDTVYPPTDQTPLYSNPIDILIR